MHLVRDVMTHSILYVTRDATVRTAVELLRAHHVQVVPVVDDGRVIGLLDALHLSLYDGEVSVEETIQDPPLAVEAELPLAQAAMQMRARKVHQVPVLQDGNLVGLLSDRDLLSVWGSVDDSLTGLPVSYQLRRWISLNLSVGREIAILFLDLDNFGQINKQRGHLFGDQVLKQVAAVLRDSVDPEMDFACRYGGDEFAVGTIRRPDSAQRLATQLRDRIDQMRINGQPAGISVSVGLAGGRRLRPRSEAHVEATLDDLITRSSTASTAAKQTPDRISYYGGTGGDLPAQESDTAPETGAPSGPRPVLESYRVGQTGQATEVIVSLRSGGESHERRVTTEAGEVTRALATATAQCLEAFAPAASEVRVEETYEFTTPQGIPCVGATVALDRDGEPPESLVGAAAIRGDVYRAYVNAVLDAMNRRLASLYEELPD
jgi:diguanylate cyclase (GGDEF)-like protein